MGKILGGLTIFTFSLLFVFFLKNQIRVTEPSIRRDTVPRYERMNVPIREDRRQDLEEFAI